MTAPPPLRGTLALIQEAWSLYLRALPRFVLLSLGTFSLVATVCGSALIWAASHHVFRAPGTALPLLGGLVVLVFVVLSLANGACSILAASLLRGDRLSLSETLRHLCRHGLPLGLTSLLLLGLDLGLRILTFGVPLLLAQAAVRPPLSAAIGMLAGGVLLLATVCMLYLYTFGFVQAIVFEGYQGLAALQRSARLVRHAEWPVVMGVMVPAAVVIGLVKFSVLGGSHLAAQFFTGSALDFFPGFLLFILPVLAFPLLPILSTVMFLELRQTRNEHTEPEEAP